MKKATTQAKQTTIPIEKKASPLIYAIFTVLMSTPLFYISFTYRPFYYPKFFILALGLLLLSIYILSHRIEITLPRPFLIPLIFFTPFFIRWIFTPFPTFSLFFTLFFLFYVLLPIMLISIDQKVHINKKILIWIWIIISQAYSLSIVLIYFKVPFVFTIMKKVGLGEFTKNFTLFGGNPNYSAEFLAFSFMALLILFFYENIEFRIISQPIIDAFIKLVFLLDILLAIVFLSSRASFAATLIGLFLYIPLAVRKNKTYLVIFLIFILLIVSLFTVPSLRSHLPNKLQNITNLNRLKRDIQLRLFHWKIAWHMGLENPIFGKGPGMFRAYITQIAKKLRKKEHINLVGYLFWSNGSPIYTLYVHDDTLEFWAEGGIFLVLYVLLLFYAIWILFYLSFWDKVVLILPLFALYLNSFFSFPLHLPIVFPFVGVYAFLLMERDKFSKTSFLVSLYYVPFLFALLLFWLSSQFFLEDYLLYNALKRDSLPLIKEAVRLNPLEMRAREELYNIALDKNAKDTAKYLASYLKLVDSPKYRFYLANLLEKEGKYKEAIENLKIALFLWDNSPDAYMYYYKLGYYYYHIKDMKNAIKFTKKGIEKNKKDLKLKIDAHINLALFYNMMGNYKEAIDEAKTTKRLIKVFLKKNPKAKDYKTKLEGLDRFIEDMKKKM